MLDNVDRNIDLRESSIVLSDKILSLWDKFDRIVRNDLQPHLIQETNFQEKLNIQNVLSVKLDTITTNDISRLNRHLKPFGLEIVFDKEKDFFNPELRIVYDSTKYTFSNIDSIIPHPKDEISNLFLCAIFKEYSRIDFEIRKFSDDQYSEEFLIAFCNKNISIARKLIKDIEEYAFEHFIELNAELTINKDQYVLLILRHYLYRLIDTIKDLYYPYLNHENCVNGNSELENCRKYIYQEPGQLIFPLLERDKKYDTIKQKYYTDLELVNQNRIASRKNPRVSIYLYDYYKSEMNDIESDTKKIRYLIDLISFWNVLLIKGELKKFSVSQRRTINEPEIEETLIPLLEAEKATLVEINTLAAFETEEIPNQSLKGCSNNGLNNNKSSRNGKAFYMADYARNPERVTNFRNALMKAEFGDKSTPLKSYQDFFQNKIPDVKIKFLGSIGDLSTMIKLMISDPVLKKILPHNKWAVVNKSFVDSSGVPFKHANLRGQDLTSKADIIKEILDTLK
jgi:hypothetical protein